MDCQQPTLSKSALSDYALRNLQEIANCLKELALKQKEPNPDADMVAFSMRKYINETDFENGDACHISACAVGHFAIMRGMADYYDEGVVTNDDEHLEWEEFSTEYIGISRAGDEGVIWEWLFSSQWAYFDDTPLGAAARIENFLEQGVPSEFHCLPEFENVTNHDERRWANSSALLTHYLPNLQALETECEIA